MSSEIHDVTDAIIEWAAAKHGAPKRGQRWPQLIAADGTSLRPRALKHDDEILERLMQFDMTRRQDGQVTRHMAVRVFNGYRHVAIGDLVRRLWL